MRDTKGIEVIVDEETFRKNAPRVSSSALGNVSTCMAESVETQKELDANKLELQEKRFKFQLGSAEKKDKRLDLARSVAQHKQRWKKMFRVGCVRKRGQKHKGT